MITFILLVMIGIKLNMLNGWYLGLLIAKFVLDTILFGIKCINLGRGE